MKRVGSVIGLDNSAIDTYEELHRDVWPGVLKQIHASSIQNFSIFRFGTLLFSYYEYHGHDFRADMEAMERDPQTQAWWNLTSPLQRPVAEAARGEWWHPLPEVFHVD